MLIHPQFDPVALQIGPVAIRWYGLMYVVAFVLFVVLGKLRARQNLLTGWHPRDVDDMLFYGMIGVIVGSLFCDQSRSASRTVVVPGRPFSSNEPTSWKVSGFPRVRRPISSAT